jgi:3-oxoadipate enol-lactonase
MATAEIRGIEYHYEVAGEGEPVLFAHCLTWNHHDYDYQVSYLKDSYKLILPDQRGHGETGFVAEPYSLEDMAEDLYQLVQMLGVGPVHYVGHSMGAMMGPLFALNHPDALRSMTLIGGSAVAESEEKLVGYRQLVGAVKAGYHEQVVERLIGLFFSEASRKHRKEAMAKFKSDFLKLDGDGLHWTAEAVFTRSNIVDRLGEIETPTLLIVGEKDIVTPRERSEELRQGIPNARMLILPEVGHFATVEAPATVSGALRDFWETI